MQKYVEKCFIDISPAFMFGTDCYESFPCQHDVIIHTHDHHLTIGEIADHVRKNKISVPLLDCTKCLSRELYSNMKQAADKSEYKSNHKCRLCGAPLYAVGTLVNNGWACDRAPCCGDYEEFFETDGVNRYACFVCGYDVCEPCIQKDEGAIKII